MRRIVMALGTVPFAAVMLGGPASADSPVSHVPLGEGFAHSHHVHTGNGGCVDIDSVYFKAENRGLHRGAEASRGPLQGPFHGSCEGEVFPGGPPVPFPPHH